MKRLLFALLCVLTIHLLSHAQIERSFLEDGKQWLMRYYGGMYRNGDYYKVYKVQGDTIINEKSWFMLYGTIVQRLSDDSFSFDTPELMGVLREEQGVVYCWKDEEGRLTDGREEYVYVNTTSSLSKGEVWAFYVEPYYRIYIHDMVREDVVEVQIEGKTFIKQQYEVPEMDGVVAFAWLDGVGAVKWGAEEPPFTTSPFTLEKYVGWGSVEEEIIDCRTGDDVLFSVASREEYAGADKVIAAIQETTMTSSASSSPIHDLQGRRMQHVPRKGVFIRNGRKVIR